MEKYVGYTQADYATPYAKFYDEAFTPIAATVKQGLSDSPYPSEKLHPLSKTTILAEKGYSEIENGYTLEADGSARVAVLTPMPDVSPKMWDWWFGWHGSMANRYKLWHPKAHLATGIQLADENLHNRPARFVKDNHLQKLDVIRAQSDPTGVFNEWHSRPVV